MGAVVLLVRLRQAENILGFGLWPGFERQK